MNLSQNTLGAPSGFIRLSLRSAPRPPSGHSLRSAASPYRGVPKTFGMLRAPCDRRIRSLSLHPMGSEVDSEWEKKQVPTAQVFSSREDLRDGSGFLSSQPVPFRHRRHIPEKHLHDREYAFLVILHFPSYTRIRDVSIIWSDGFRRCLLVRVTPSR